MGGEAAMQDVRFDGEYLVEGIHAEPPLLHAIISGQHQFRDRMGARVETQKPIRSSERVPACLLRVAFLGERSTNRSQEHMQFSLVKLRGVARGDDEQA